MDWPLAVRTLVTFYPRLLARIAASTQVRYVKRRIIHYDVVFMSKGIKLVLLGLGLLDVSYNPVEAIF